jgi:hypothetical protein
VASGILGEIEYQTDPVKLQRARQLDPIAAAKYRPRVFRAFGATTPPNMEAMYRQQVADKKAAKTLVQRARDQENAGQPCAAEELYTQAASKDTSSEVYEYTEGLGRAGLKCGDLPGARAGLEAAILKQTAFIKGTDEDQLTTVRNDLLTDREYLVVVYEREHEGALAAGVCSDAHKSWKGCSCVLGKTGDVKCTEKR